MKQILLPVLTCLLFRSLNVTLNLTSS
uniref:Uncharacterized protein n=1 Tax=Anguilla anguilla TaxID=7936 RepID=A0A0E9QZA6_ANGAN